MSVDSRGRQGNLASNFGSASADGRFVVFDSDADNLVPNDTNGATDVFLRDRRLDRTWRVSLSAAGAQAAGGGSFGSITPDGRYVLFQSDSPDLVAGDTNAASDVFLLDRRSGRLRRVSVGAGGRQADAQSFASTVSDDGRLVVFSSYAGNLVPGDSNGTRDLFVRDLERGVTRRVSVATDGAQANGDSFGGKLSRDGRLLAFSSAASNLVPGDTNDTPDVFVRDLGRGTTERVSVASDGSEAAPGFSFGESMSADGRFVAFQSGAANLVPGDDNSATDVFVRDRLRGRTERVVLGGGSGTGSVGAALSPSGRFIAVSALFDFDLYLVDRRTGVTRLVDRPRGGGAAAAGSSFAMEVSADGRRVVFYSEQPDLVPGDSNGVGDVFLRQVPPWPAGRP